MKIQLYCICLYFLHNWSVGNNFWNFYEDILNGFDFIANWMLTGCCKNLCFRHDVMCSKVIFTHVATVIYGIYSQCFMSINIWNIYQLYQMKTSVDNGQFMNLRCGHYMSLRTLQIQNFCTSHVFGISCYFVFMSILINFNAGPQI